jgi:uncharacterized membrane protein
LKTRGPNARFISLTGLLLAAAVLFPVVFHQFGIAGRVFLPMHIPIFLAGLVLGPWAGLVVGILSPGLSSLLTGMPTATYAVLMTPELATYGMVSGLLSTRDRGHIWIALIGAMIAGRVVWCCMAVLIAPLLGFGGRTFTVALAALAVGWPGVLLQLLFVPVVLSKVQKALLL